MAHSHGDHDRGHDHGPGHAHGHHHGHAHGLAPGALDRAFAIGTALNAGFVIAEVVFGLAANSLSLLADAAHNLGDVLGLLIAWGALWLGRLRPTEVRTYGYGRSSILASLVNAIVLLISVGAIAVEAVQRFATPQPVAETTVILVAAIGIVINGGTALLFMSGRKRDLNVQGAFLHMVADAAVSFGVVVATVAIGLRGLSGVCEVHDLHIWALSTTETAITAHLVVVAGVTADTLIATAAREVKERFAIGHATFQVESQTTAADCALAPDHVV
jgi:cobalt-zinc-cadmium efflux system protein